MAGHAAQPIAAQCPFRPMEEHRFLIQPTETGTDRTVNQNLHEIQRKLGTGNNHNNRSNKDECIHHFGKEVFHLYSPFYTVYASSISYCK